MSVEGKSEEIVIEEVKNVVVNLEALSLIELLKKKLEVGVKDNKLTLSDEEVVIIIKLLEGSPSYFNDIEKTLVEIIKDNKIDSTDIPNIIALIQKLYELIYNIKAVKLDGNKRCEICASILKCLIHLLVEERIIKIDDEQKTKFLNDVDKLIDSFIGLLRLPKELKTKNCLQTIFGNK